MHQVLQNGQMGQKITKGLSAHMGRKLSLQNTRQ